MIEIDAPRRVSPSISRAQIQACATSVAVIRARHRIARSSVVVNRPTRIISARSPSMIPLYAIVHRIIFDPPAPRPRHRISRDSSPSPSSSKPPPQTRFAHTRPPANPPHKSSAFSGCDWSESEISVPVKSGVRCPCSELKSSVTCHCVGDVPFANVFDAESHVSAAGRERIHPESIPVRARRAGRDRPPRRCSTPESWSPSAVACNNGSDGVDRRRQIARRIASPACRRSNLDTCTASARYASPT